MAVEDQVVQLFAATNGFLDRITTDRVPELLDGLAQRTRAESADLLEKIRGGDWSDETQEALRAQVADFADDFGYDLDEEGQPLDERQVGETTRKQEGIRGGDSGDSGGESDSGGDGDGGVVADEGTPERDEQEAAATA